VDVDLRAARVGDRLETEAAGWQRLIEAVGLILRMSEEGAE